MKLFGIAIIALSPATVLAESIWKEAARNAAYTVPYSVERIIVTGQQEKTRRQENDQRHQEEMSRQRTYQYEAETRRVEVLTRASNDTLEIMGRHGMNQAGAAPMSNGGMSGIVLANGQVISQNAAAMGWGVPNVAPAQVPSNQPAVEGLRRKK